MALNGDILGAAIMAAIDAEIAGTPIDTTVRADIWKAVGNAIVNHIQLNAVVTLGVASAAGVQPGAGTAIVTGTGSLT